MEFEQIISYFEVVLSFIVDAIVNLYQFLEKIFPDPIYAQVLFALPVLYFLIKVLLFIFSIKRSQKISKAGIGNRIDMGDGLVVRSFPESYIVEFLQKMDIPFDYEKRIVLDDVVIYPDFTLYPESDDPIYLEHFGVKNMKSYDKKTKLKKKLYKKYHKRSFIFTDVNDKRRLIKQLRKQLRRVKVI